MPTLILQLLKGFAVPGRFKVLLVAVALTFALWISLNSMWPEAKLEYSESFALFVLALLIVSAAHKTLKLVERWIARLR